jgi:hypothetical protein
MVAHLNLQELEGTQRSQIGAATGMQARMQGLQNEIENAARRCLDIRHFS